jgi:hypothetical protein
MSFKDQRGTRTLRVFAVALGVFLLADGGTSARAASPMVMGAEMPQFGNPAASAACKPILDASEKLYTTPYHLYMTQASDGVENGKPVRSEMIFVGGTGYVLVNGKWNPSPLSAAEMKAMDARNRKNATNVSCHHVRDESVNGESAALYSMHSETSRSKNDDQIWISKSKGVILRQDTELVSIRGNGKTHLSTHYDYNNVQAPKP